MNSVINGSVIDRYQCLYKVVLIQLLASGIDPFEDVRNLFFICFCSYLNCRNLIFLNIKKPLKVFIDCFYLIILQWVYFFLLSACFQTCNELIDESC